jgi:hypothetical protein
MTEIQLAATQLSTHNPDPQKHKAADSRRAAHQRNNDRDCIPCNAQADENHATMYYLLACRLLYLCAAYLATLFSRSFSLLFKTDMFCVTKLREAAWFLVFFAKDIGEQFEPQWLF